MKIYIWGTGRMVGKVVGKYVQLEEIEAFIDNDVSKKEYMGKRVLQPIQIVTMEYDAILVSNLYGQEIYKQCKDLGIDINKVILIYDNVISFDTNKDYDLIANILGNECAKIIRDRYHLVRGVEAYNKPYMSNENGGGYYNKDYVRMECFDLAIKEIYKRNVQGAVAELGVFRGEFAQYINSAFPERKLYLFDTFEGFDAAEALREKKKGNCTNALIEAYQNTNIEYVLEHLTYLDNVIIKQGLFPESLEGLEERFAFVSLDVDFEDSIYEGLKYFYPRLERGGYIFIHDYNSDLMGVEKAVDKYESDINIMLCKVPLCDANGTLVITKA